MLSARVRPGRSAAVLDISATGALIETTHRLLPGSFVDVQLDTTEQRTSVRGRVLRCAVCGVSATGVRYHGAIEFDDRLSWFADAAAFERPSPLEEAPSVHHPVVDDGFPLLVDSGRSYPEKHEDSSPGDGNHVDD